MFPFSPLCYHLHMYGWFNGNSFFVIIQFKFYESRKNKTKNLIVFITHVLHLYLKYNVFVRITTYILILPKLYGCKKPFIAIFNDISVFLLFFFFFFCKGSAKKNSAAKVFFILFQIFLISSTKPTHSLLDCVFQSLRKIASNHL